MQSDELLDLLAKLHGTERELVEEKLKGQELDKKLAETVEEKDDIHAIGADFALSVVTLRQKLEQMEAEYGAFVERARGEAVDAASECDSLRLLLAEEQSSHKQTLDQITIAWANLTSILEEEEQKRAALTRERDVLRCELARQRKRTSTSITTTAKEHEGLVALLAEARGEVGRLEAQRFDLSVCIEKDKRLIELKTEIAEQEHNSLAAELEAVNVKLLKIECERDAMAQSFQIAQKDIATLEAERQSSLAMTAKLTTTINEEQQKARKLDASLAASKRLQDELDAEVKRFGSVNNELVSAVERLRSENAILGVEAKDGRSSLERMAAVIEDLRAENTREKEKRGNLEAVVPKITMRLTAAHAKSAAQESQLRGMQSERDRLSQKLKDAVNASEREKQARLAMEHERNVLANELSATQGKPVAGNNIQTAPILLPAKASEPRRATASNANTPARWTSSSRKATSARLRALSYKS